MIKYKINVSFIFLILSNSTEPTRLRWKFFIISTMVLVLSLIEHVLSIFNNIDGYEWNESNSTFHNFLEIYTLRSHSFIFDTCESLYLIKKWNQIIEYRRNDIAIYIIKVVCLFSVNYNFVYGLYVFVVSKVATFTWNFTDLFIMLVSRIIE